VVLFDGSAGSAVVGLGCGVTERRGAAMDSAVGVPECAGYSSCGMNKEASSSAWRAKATLSVAWWARGATATRGAGSGDALAWSEQRRLDALSCGARSEDVEVV
jgi:hypothetical protein